MPGPTAWQQISYATNIATQAITTTNETVIATLAGLDSRQAGGPILLLGYAQFAVNASTTGVTLRVRQDSLTGSLVQAAAAVAMTAATATFDQLNVLALDQPTGEYAGKTYVLTIQATAAAANWNNNAAVLVALV